MSRFILCVLCCGLLAPGALSAELAPVGSEAKRFLNLNLQNQHVGLRDYVGPQARQPVKALILSFWSVSCIPCRKEMPLVQAWQSTRSGDVALLFINLDKKDQQNAVLDFINQYQITAPVLLDFYQTTGKTYGVCDGSNCAVPALFAIDGTSGLIRLAISGFESEKKLDSLLSDATAERSSPNRNAPPLDAQTKQKILTAIFANLPHETLAQTHGISQEQLLELLKEAESAAKKQWK